MSTDSYPVVNVEVETVELDGATLNVNYFPPRPVSEDDPEGVEGCAIITNAPRLWTDEQIDAAEIQLYDSHVADKLHERAPNLVQ